MASPGPCGRLATDLWTACHEDVGEQASTMMDKEVLVVFCDATQAPCQDACRRGAGL